MDDLHTFDKGLNDPQTIVENGGKPARKRGRGRTWGMYGAAALAFGLGLSAIHFANVRDHKKTPEGEAFKIAARLAGDKFVDALDKQNWAKSHLISRTAQTEAATAVAKARESTCVSVSGMNGEEVCLKPMPVSRTVEGDPVYVQKTPIADGFVLNFAAEASSGNPNREVTREDVKVKYGSNGTTAATFSPTLP